MKRVMLPADWKFGLIHLQTHIHMYTKICLYQNPKGPGYIPFQNTFPLSMTSVKIMYYIYAIYLCIYNQNLLRVLFLFDSSLHHNLN
jgi:hypothetical protein